MAVTLPTAYWKFDESSGNAADATAGGLTLTNNNTATYAAEKINNGVVLASASSQSMSRASTASLHPTTSMSLSFWVKFTTTPGSGANMRMASGYRNSGNNNGFLFYLQNAAGTLKLQTVYYDDLGSAGTGFSVNWTPTTGTLYYLTLTQVFATKAVHIYINGVDQTLAAGGSGSTAMGSTNSPFNIGTIDGGGEYVNGAIDEFGFWGNYALTQAEVTSLYNSNSGLAYPFTPATLTPSVSDSSAVSDTSTIRTILQGVTPTADSTAVSDTPTIRDTIYIDQTDGLTDTTTVSATPTIRTTIYIDQTDGLADSSVVSDTPTVYITTRYLSVSDSSAIGEIIALSGQDEISVFDSSTVSDTPTIFLTTLVLSVTDSSAVGDTDTVSASTYISVSDSTTIGEAVTMAGTEILSVSDSTAVSDSTTQNITTLFLAASDSTTVGEVVTFSGQEQISVVDTTVVSDNATLYETSYSITVSDSTTVSDAKTLYESPYFISTTDATTASDSTSVVVGASGLSVADTTPVSDTSTITESSPQISVFDSTAIGEAVTLAISSVAADTISVFDVTTVTDSSTFSLTSLINASDATTVTDSATIGESILAKGYSFVVFID